MAYTERPFASHQTRAHKTLLTLLAGAAKQLGVIIKICFICFGRRADKRLEAKTTTTTAAGIDRDE